MTTLWNKLTLSETQIWNWTSLGLIVSGICSFATTWPIFWLLTLYYLMLFVLSIVTEIKTK